MQRCTSIGLQHPDNGITNGLLNADPTLQYGLSTGELRPEGHPLLAGTEGSFLPVDEWGNAEWWPQLQVSGGEVALEEYLLGFQTYTQPGLPPTPIASPRTSSLAAVANAPLDEGYPVLRRRLPERRPRRLALLRGAHLPSTTPTSRRPTRNAQGYDDDRLRDRCARRAPPHRSSTSASSMGC